MGTYVSIMKLCITVGYFLLSLPLSLCVGLSLICLGTRVSQRTPLCGRPCFSPFLRQHLSLLLPSHVHQAGWSVGFLEVSCSCLPFPHGGTRNAHSLALLSAFIWVLGGLTSASYTLTAIALPTEQSPQPPP